jgi:ribose-phosphate pyrophosphokinase
MKDHRCVLFAGQASEPLASRIVVPGNGIEAGSILHKKFPSGEYWCQIQENIRGADVFLIQATSHPCNDNLMQLLIMAECARRASAGRITAILPYMCYSRQERKDKSRVPISAKLVMDLIAVSGIDRVVTMDLHAAQIAGFTNIPVDNLYFEASLIQYLKTKSINIDVIVAPDIGGVKRASELSKKMHKGLALVAKNRVGDTDVETIQFVGDVKDKNVLIIDDLTESAGTLVNAAEECQKNGAKTIRCAISHNCITDVGEKRLIGAFVDGTIERVFVSNSIRESRGERWMETIDVAPVFTSAIDCIHNNKSVSSLF